MIRFAHCLFQMYFKSYFSFSLFIFPVFTNSFSQEPDKKKDFTSKPKKQDQILFDIHSSQILRQEGAGVSPKWYSYGVTFSLFNDAPIKKTPLSIAIGAGVSNENYFLNKEIMRNANGGTDFVPAAVGLKRYKLSFTTLEVPVEIRIRIRPERTNTVKINLGFSLGYVVQSKVKRSGEGNQFGDTVSRSKVKEYNIPGFDNFRFIPYLRMGWSRYSITARYHVNALFKSGKGPLGWNPISLGFALTPF